MATNAATSDLASLLRQVDELAATPNPETTPYASHYQIIEILNKWLTTPLDPVDQAVAHAKLGATYLHVEEPHNAQPALEKAGQVFFPELLQYATQASPSPPDNTAPPPSVSDVKKLLAKLPVVRLTSDRVAPRHVLELLNQSGILWFNRSLPLRALCFFKACAELCSHLEEQSAAPKESEIVALRTHAYFYLAQVYGSLQRADESALYCLATLELQLLTYTEDGSDVDGWMMHEWIKNGLRLVDYYVETENGAQAAACLNACEFMLSRLSVGDSDDQVSEDERNQRRAEMFLAWARLHQQTLQLSQLHREGVAPAPRRLEYVDSVVRRVSLEDSLRQLMVDTSGSGMHYVPAQQVASYDHARDVFKMGASACEAALEVFVLDGFVTAHIQLLQLQSQLYRRLIAWETDLKRQIAMHLRRLSLLTPLLGDAINPRAYCAKLQELYYESAETAVEIFDLKQFKKRGADASDAKTTAYMLKAINWYQQYLFLFYTSDEGDQTAARARITGQDKMILGGSSIGIPTGSASMTSIEFKSILHGFFSLARACSKIVVPQDHEKTVLLWKKSIEYHEAVLSLVKKYQQLPGNESNATKLKEAFRAEMAICEEMLELLPEKINQLVYNGRAL